MNDRIVLVKQAYLTACRRELEVAKPGNVSLQSAGHDMVADDFLVSADVSAPALVNFNVSLGQRIYDAIAATREAVQCNTNLGIVLLAAPLMDAAMGQQRDESLHQSVARVLAQTTIDDAQWVFKGINLASPAGLGRSSEHDVNTAASVTLTAAMQAAQSRDFIAKQYANDFSEIFNFALPLLMKTDVEPDFAVVKMYLSLLANFPDSHIQRKFGTALAKGISRQAEKWLKNVSDSRDQAERDAVLRQADASLKQRNINPGTSADLTVATLLAQQLVLL